MLFLALITQWLWTFFLPHQKIHTCVKVKCSNEKEEELWVIPHLQEIVSVIWSAGENLRCSICCQWIGVNGNVFSLIIVVSYNLVLCRDLVILLWLYLTLDIECVHMADLSTALHSYCPFLHFRITFFLRLSVYFVVFVFCAPFLLFFYFFFYFTVTLVLNHPFVVKVKYNVTLLFHH